jgi:hypothetical protein
MTGLAVFHFYKAELQGTGENRMFMVKMEKWMIERKD